MISESVRNRIRVWNGLTPSRSRMKDKCVQRFKVVEGCKPTLLSYVMKCGN